MNISLRNALLVAIALMPFAFPITANADTVEAIYALEVSNPGIVVGALDQLFESDDMQGHFASLWAVEFNGASPTTHVIAAPNMTELNEYLDGLLGSSTYRSFVQAVRSIRSINTVNMYQRVMAWE